MLITACSVWGCGGVVRFSYLAKTVKVIELQLSKDGRCVCLSPYREGTAPGTTYMPQCATVLPVCFILPISPLLIVRMCTSSSYQQFGNNSKNIYETNCRQFYITILVANRPQIETNWGCKNLKLINTVVDSKPCIPLLPIWLKCMCSKPKWGSYEDQLMNWKISYFIENVNISSEIAYS